MSAVNILLSIKAKVLKSDSTNKNRTHNICFRRYTIYLSSAACEMIIFKRKYDKVNMHMFASKTLFNERKHYLQFISFCKFSKFKVFDSSRHWIFRYSVVRYSCHLHLK